MRVLHQQPATLNDALAIACRMEAYGTTFAASNEMSAAEADRPDRRRVRAVNVESKKPKMDMRQLQRLESELADQRRQIRQLHAESDYWKARAESVACATSCANAADILVATSIWIIPAVRLG